MQTQSLTQFDPSRFFQLPTTDPQAGRTITAQVGAIQSSTDFSGKVSVVTAEGDKVTFSLDAETSFRFANYQCKAQGNEKSLDVKGESADSSQSQTLGLTVEGDLNDQEVADLSKLFKSVTSIFRQFFSGQDEQAVAKTAKLAERFGNFSTLAGLDMSVDVTRSMTVLAAQQTAAPVAMPSAQGEGTAVSPAPHPDTPGDVLTAVAAIPPPSSDTTAPATTPAASTTGAVTQGAAPSTAAAVPSPSSGTTTPVPKSSQPASLVQQVLDAIQDARVEPQKLNKYFSRFLKDLEQALQNGKIGDKQAEGSQANQAPSVPAQTGSTTFQAYQSTSQSSITLSVHT